MGEEKEMEEKKQKEFVTIFINFCLVAKVSSFNINICRLFFHFRILKIVKEERKDRLVLVLEMRICRGANS